MGAPPLYAVITSGGAVAGDVGGDSVPWVDTAGAAASTKASVAASPRTESIRLVIARSLRDTEGTAGDRKPCLGAYYTAFGGRGGVFLLVVDSSQLAVRGGGWGWW